MKTLCANCDHSVGIHGSKFGCANSPDGVEVCGCTWHERGGAARNLQVGGDHYSKFRIQPWDIWQEYGLDAFTGAILKYLLRDKGNRLEDLKKARHTLDRLIEIEEEKEG